MQVMAILKLILCSILALLLVVNVSGCGLKPRFYEYSCPDAENIVQQATTRIVKQEPNVAATLIRLLFHDCFVRGCDASVLLKPTKTNNQTELTSAPDLTLRGFNVIDAIKQEVENRCPGVVSCADILSLAARDAMKEVYGPYWEVPTGRRDGRVSSANEALANIPPPTSNISSLKTIFASKGLNVKDLVVLSGAHTLGVSHCSTIRQRLYNFTGKGDTDPALDPNYAAWLKKICKPISTDSQTVVAMDPTPNKFDLGYYSTVSYHRGLFQSDAALLNDGVTKSYIKLQLSTMGSTFFKDFATSMVKMNHIGVLTGNAGEIRKKCGFVN